MQIGLLTLDKARCVGLFNSAAEQLLGYRARDVRGTPCEQILNGLTRSLASPAGQQRGDKRAVQMKISARHKDGREVPLVATAYVTPKNDEPRDATDDVILVFQEAAALERLENQLRHLNKLQSLDQFAAGIVHEIRNPLAGISTTAQCMLENIGPSERFREEVQDILADVVSIEGIVSKVLDFAHPSKSQVHEGPIEDVVEEVLRFSKMLLRRQGIRLLISLDKSPANVSVDASQMKQVFFNIVRNACEAMSEGGELRVTTSRLRAGSGKGHVRVEVEDTGRGIAEEHLERIFDPFFSVRRGGTGLGLAISRKIVESYGGRIEAKSQLGKGTTFGVVLPMA
jgi:signal transduction histidine kinase